MSPSDPVPPGTKPRVGVSACLIGWEVRYAGGHKWNALVAEAMGQSVEWIPVCPELEIGLGVPREPIELVGDPGAPELMGVESRRPLAAMMRAWAARRLDEMERQALSGYVLKARSPSCGPRSVPVYASVPAMTAADPHPEPITTGTGIFARVLLDRFPGLPVVDEAEFTSPEAVRVFLERVFEFRARHYR